MCERKRLLLAFLMILAGALFLLLGIPATPAYANQPFPISEQDTCLSCHEDLYFLYDTGKWYCLRKAPMVCSDCHGGDPTAATQAKAHSQRTVHPIINGDVTKCCECHPEQSAERVEIFEHIAGIKPVTVAVAYAPVVSMTEKSVLPVTGAEQSSTTWFGRAGVAVITLVSMTLIIALSIKFHRSKEHHP